LIDSATMEHVFGYIDKITFQNPETGFTVAQLIEKGRSESTCIVGMMPTVQPGESVRCYGEWKTHLVYGRQFDIKEFKTEAPADIIAIKKYLGSGLIKGIGSAYAARIVEKFGIETLNIIDQAPELLKEISGFGPKRIELIKSCWQEQKSIRDVMIFLQSVGVSPAFAQKIFKTYGAHSVAKVKENPYHLAKDIFGIGFKTADQLAQKLGIAADSPQRIDSGIEYVLSELSNDGHVCYPVANFLTAAQQMLEVDSGLIQQRLNSLYENRRINLSSLVHDAALTPFIWLNQLYVCETGIAREVKRLRSHSSDLRAVDLPKALEWVQNQLSIKLADNQKTAVAISLSEKMHIITGGPGTGKSTITKAILSITSKLTNKILLAAPTGRAAKRMSEITGYKASTIHSLLEYDFKKRGFKRNREFPLDCDLIIIDESSMIDTALMYNLLKAIPDYARVVFIGDINQLPSVGPGNVLKDMIQAKSMKVTMLTEIFRQAAGSRIITNAHRINKGIFPDISNLSDSDFYFIEAETPEDVLKNILGLVVQRLPKKYGFDPLRDIQVLAPMRRGLIGTENLNASLQEALNRRDNPIFRAGRKFLIGDKVMQLRNDYKREVYNGDIGYIIDIDQAEQQVVVQIDERSIVYEFSDLDELTLSYAVSIHKYQGSECPCIIIPVHTTHYMLLHRNLIYTGITRGKKLVILVGLKKALGIAVRNNEVENRFTGLQQALIETWTSLR
jgi:exodeoxyribonuclease V alpha subunit